MKLKYLGTAAAEGIPALFCNCDTCKKARLAGGKDIRSRSQAMIDGKLLIDFPADSFMHMQKYNIDITPITTLIFTHSHADHFYPKDLFYRSPPYASKVNNTLEVYGNKVVSSYCKKQLEIHKMWNEKALHINYVPPFIPFEAEDMTITPLLANHNKAEDCYIYLIEKDNKRMLYAHDTGFLPEASSAFLKEKPCDLISLDCTMGLIEDGNNHLGLNDVYKMVDKFKEQGTVNKNTKIVINHFSHNGGLLQKDYEARVKEKGFIVAYDGMEINV